MAKESIRIFIDKALENSQKQNPEVKAETPVFNVINIMLDPLADGGVSPIAVDLRPAGNSRPHLMLYHITRDFLPELIHKLRTLRARADETHFSCQDIKELRHFVNAGAPQKASEFRHPVISRDCPALLLFLRRLHSHGAELVHGKRL